MYKRFYILVLTVLALASCTKEAVPTMSEVRFLATVSPEILTRGGGAEAASTEDIIINHAVLQAWLGENLVVNVEQQVTQETTQIDFGVIRLVGGVDYDVYIWVDNEGYYNTSDLRNVCLADGKDDDDALKSDALKSDAFYAYTPVNYGQDNEVHNVTLYRPFAKLCFSAEVDSQLNVKFTAPTTFNLKTGEVSGERKIDYTVDSDGASVTTFDYIFATEEVSQLSYTFKLGEAEKTTSVPVKRNTKTNIIYKVTSNDE